MIYDGVISLIDSGQIEEAQKVLEAVMNGEELAAYIASGGTAEEYIRQIFRDQGVA